MQITDEMIEAAAKAFWPDGITYKTERRQSVRAMLEAALAAAWRPIETAPKDGTALFAVGSRAVLTLIRAHKQGLGILGQPVKHIPSGRRALEEANDG